MSVSADIQARKNGFYFRKVIPLDVRPHFGGKLEIVRALGKDPDKARVSGRDLSVRLEKLFLDAREGTNAGTVPVVPSIRRKPKAKQKISESHDPKLSEALDTYQAERRLPPKTLIEVSSAVGRFKQIVGDKPISKITKADARQFKASLLKVPRTCPEKLRGASVVKIIAACGDDPSVRKIAPKTIQKAMGGVSAVLGWAEANGLIDTNPFSKVRVVGSQHTGPSRLPYSTDDLKAIFSSPIFAGCLSADRRGTPGSVIIRDHSFWLPWLGLFTGCRLEEMCQALLTDVQQVEGVYLIDINMLGAGKHLKTAGSVRRVPLHPKLIEMGFLEYVASLRAAGETQLFPKLKRDNRGAMSAMWSKFWGRYSRKVVKITDARKVFHSFRHNFKDACRAARIPEEVHDALTGHSNGSIGRGYGLGIPLSVLAEAIARIGYECARPSLQENA